MRKYVDGGRKRREGRGKIVPLALLVLTLILGLIAVAACSPQGLAQSATATANANATIIASPSPAVTATSPSTATIGPGAPPIAPTVGITATGVVTPAETPAPRPTPTGEPPDPLSVLNIYRFFSPSAVLVSRDLVDLDGKDTGEILYTITEGAVSITEELRSGIAVLTYDSVYRQWIPVWASPPITGAISPLPSANRSAAGGYNGGKILGSSGPPILVARTTTRDGKAHLQLWRWDVEKQEGVPLKMRKPNGGDVDVIFEAELDANVADIDDDGIYEVVLDNLAAVQVWTWDGAAQVFVLKGDR